MSEALRGGRRRLGRPAGVLQLLDRHNRDCEIDRRRDSVCPLHAHSGTSVPDTPFEVIPRHLPSGVGAEIALWWADDRVR